MLEKLRGWWNGVPASWLVEEPDEALTQVLLNAGWLPDRTGRWCLRPLDQSSHLPNANVSDGVALEPVTADDDLELWLDVASECGWIEDLDDRGVRRDLLRPAAADPRQAMWLARLDDRPEGMVRGWCSEREPVVEVVDVAVRAPVRRQGVGKALVSRVLAWAPRAERARSWPHQPGRLASLRRTRVRERTCRYLTPPSTGPGERAARPLHRPTHQFDLRATAVVLEFDS